jgi:hypothetical protein
MVPVVDLEQAATVDGDRNIVNLMGGKPAQQPARYAVGSPIRMLPVGIPVTCVHGDADTTVPIARSQQYVAAAPGSRTAHRTPRREPPRRVRW